MGYPRRDAAMIATTMAEEREHQGLGVDVAAANLAYLRVVAPQAVDFINTLERFVSPGRPNAALAGARLRQRLGLVAAGGGGV